MTYIPNEHKKFEADGLLNHCRRLKTEFIYRPSSIISLLEYRLEKFRISIIPHGFKSSEDYFSYLNEVLMKYKNKIPNFEEDVNKLCEAIKEGNRKEEWSICRYVGKEEDYIIPDLTTGKVYYWPTSLKNPVYHGVVDNEEYDTYPHSTKNTDWEIIEDPTGMAYRMLNSNDDTGEEYYKIETSTQYERDYKDSDFELVSFDVRYEGETDDIFESDKIYHVEKIIKSGYEQGCFWINLGEDEDGDSCFYITDPENFVKI